VFKPDEERRARRRRKHARSRQGLALTPLRLLLEALERRDLLTAGTTIITHGFQRWQDPITYRELDEVTDWTREMGIAISSRASPTPIVELGYYFESDNLISLADDQELDPASFSASAATEYIVYTFWNEKSNNSAPGWAETVGDGLYSMLRRFRLANTLAEAGSAALVRSLHFIGHSFGTVVNSEAIQRLGAFDQIIVDQMTTLDPHDWDELWIPVDGDAMFPDVHVWSNVVFADNYYATEGGFENPHGRPVAGAVNVNLTNLPGFHDGHFFFPHRRVHDYYRNTINPGLIENDDYSIDQNAWYVGQDIHSLGYSAYARIAEGELRPASQAFRVNPAQPLDALASSDYGMAMANANGQPDIGQDPPQRIFNGSFYIGEPGLTVPLQETAGFIDGATGNPRIYLDESRIDSNHTALLSTYDEEFSFRPFYFPANSTELSFYYDVRTPDPIDLLELTFYADNNQIPVTFDASSILRSTARGTMSINATNFLDFNQLRGKLVTLRFELDSPIQPALPIAAVLIDDVTLRTGTTLPAQPEVTVHQATGTEIVSNTAAVTHFGSTVVGQTPLVQTFRVTNEGTANLTLGVNMPLPAGFVVTEPLAGTLAPGMSDTFTVQLSSASVGAFAGTIDIVTNDSDETIFRIPISGTVIANTTRPDLKLVMIDGPTSAAVNTSITIHSEVRNLESVASGNYSVVYRLSSNTTIDATDRTIAIAPRNGIAAHSVATWDQVIHLPGDLAAGAYWLGAEVIPSDLLNEKDDTNQRAIDTQSLRIDVPSTVNAGFQFPTGTPGRGSTVTQHFGQGFATHRGHLGTDFAGATGSPVYAVADGVVTFSANAGPQWGQVVIVKHATTSWGWSKDVYSFYAHVESLVFDGQQVRRGQKIATIGPTAVDSTGPHLHFAIRDGAEAAEVPGPGYRGFDFVRSQNPQMTYPGYSITWYDPYKVLSENLFGGPAAPQPIDLWATDVSGPSSALAGSTIHVTANVVNPWPTDSGGYQVKYVLSTDRKISNNDLELRTVTRPGIAESYSDPWTLRIEIPAAVASGKYYFGIIVDPNGSVSEVEENNNTMASAAPIIIRSAAVSQPDLVARSLRLRSQTASLDWGQTFTVAYDVRNAGAATAGTSNVLFQLTDNPLQPTWTVALGSRAVSSLPAGNTAGAQVDLRLPSSRPSGYRGGALFVRMIVDSTSSVVEADETNNSGQGQGEDWVEIESQRLKPLPAGKADLVGVDFLVSPGRAFFEWGQPIELEYTFKNRGGTAASYFNYQFFLSTDANFDASDYRIRTRSFGVLDPTEEHTETISYTLPSSAPIGLADGPMYLGVVLDPENRVDESNENNNRRVGNGIDFIQLTIVTPAPVSLTPEPVIGSFTASPSTRPVLRGEQVWLAANDVTDDNHAAYEVVFRLDTNGNGQWDESDLYLAHGSKNGTTFTATVRSNSNWPLGTRDVLARATDNHGIHSAIARSSITVTGIGSGPFPDDSLENNDTLETATFLGGGQEYVLSNLALAEGDPDHFAFDIIGDASRLQIDLNFVQEAFQGAGLPVGDLSLELRRIGSSASYGFSNTSVAGNTNEQIVREAGAGSTLASGRYVVIVSGNSGLERNPNYGLRIQITPPAGAPTAGELVVSESTRIQGELITLSMQGITGVPDSGIDGVHFYNDLNNDGMIQFDQEYLGSGWSPGGGRVNGLHWLTTSTATWNLGANRLLAVVSTTSGYSSLAQIKEVVVGANSAPTAASLTSPATAIQGGTVALTANNVVDADGSVAQVAFALDTDENGIWDGNDLELGSGVPSGGNWTGVFATADWPIGEVRVFAAPVDNLGLAGNVVTTTLVIEPSDNVQPVLGSFSAPDFVTQGDPLTLTVSDAEDPNGDSITVQFFDDTNQDGALDSGDQHLGNGVPQGNQWTLTIPTAGRPNGATRFFAEVVDNGIPSFRTSTALVVTVIDVAGPRVVSQVPSAPAPGSIDSVRLEFNEPIDPASFTLSDVTAFTGPSGPLTATSVGAVAGSDNTVFEVRFDRQTSVGAYSLTVGPDILDQAGNAMDQDADGILGETSDDRYTLPTAVEVSLVEFGWAKAIGGTNLEFVAALANDAAGNLYITGQFAGTSDFDPGPGQVLRTSNTGSRDIYVAKYTSAGALVWVQTYGSDSSSEYGQQIAVDSSNNVYVTGYFSGTVNFGGASRTSNGNADIFVLKLNSSGGTSWVQTMGGSASDFGRGLALDSSGNVFVTGTYEGTVNFLGQNRTGVAFWDAFLLKLTNAGALSWVQTMGGTHDDSAWGVAVDSAGDVYTVGSFGNTADFNRGGSAVNRTSSGGMDIFITKRTSSGAFAWVQTIGAAPSEEALAVAVDDAKNVYVTGDFQLTVDFNPQGGVDNLVSQGNFDVFTLKLDTNGNFGWARSFGGSSTDIGRAIKVDSSRNVYVAGEFTGSAEFNVGGSSATRTSAGGLDSFAAKLNPDGNFTWAQSAGGTSDDQAFGIAIDGSKNVVVAGRFAGTADFDPGAAQLTLDSAGSTDVFLWQLRQLDPNTPPTLNAIADRTVDENALVGFTISASDPDAGQTLTYSLDTDAPAGAMIHPTTGVFSWTPSEIHGGASFPIRVFATDNGAGQLRDAKTFVVTVNEVNLAPQLAAIVDQTIFERIEMQVTAQATDADLPLQTIAYSLDAGAPSGMTIEATTGVLRWRPTEAQGPGVFSVTVRATDNGSPPRSDTKPFSVIVRESNQTPSLNPVGNQLLSLGDSLNFSLSALDADLPANSLVYSVDEGAPAGLTVNPTTGAVQWLPGVAGTYSATFRVVDGGVPNLSDTETITIVVSNGPLATAAQFESGVSVSLNRAINLGLLNLYDEGSTFGPADVTLVGATTGAVRGSLVVDATGRNLTFIRSGGPLVPDDYTLTLRAASDGVQDSSGNLLDGDANGSAGGNFATTFTAPALDPAAVVVSIPDITRGTGQAIHLPADSSAGLPISISNAQGVGRVAFSLHYDPALLSITGASLGPGISGSLTVDISTPGVAEISVVNASGLSLVSGLQTMVSLTASVPGNATYASKQILNLTDLHVHDTSATPIEMPSLADDGIQLIAYFGDANGSQTYNAPDATATQRMIVGTNTGLAAYQLADPYLVVDITGNGLVQSNDVTQIQRAIVGLSTPEIPTIPGTPAAVVGGPDPVVSISQYLSAAVGESITVPIELLVTEPTGITLAGADLAIAYNDSVLQIDRVTAGELMVGFGLNANLSTPGIIRLSLGGSEMNLPHQALGVLANLQFTVIAGADSSSRLNLLATHEALQSALYDGLGRALTLSPVPTNADDDAVDGLLEIRPATLAQHIAAVDLALSDGDAF